MKNLLSIIALLSISISSFGQIEIDNNMAKKPSRPSRYSLAVDEVNDTVPYLIKLKPGSLVVTERKSFLVDAVYMTIAQVRGLNVTLRNLPKYVYIKDEGKEGVFRLDFVDVTSTDNTGTVLVTLNGRRYKRTNLENGLNALWFDTKGNNIFDDTDGLQKLLTAACSANNPLVNVAASPSNRTNVAIIPHGIYKVTNELIVKGSCEIRMEQATSYGGTRIQQNTPNKHLFKITADTDGASSAVHFIGGILKSGVGVTNADIALVYCGNSAGDGNANSTYFDNVWFQTPETYAINMKRGDDIQIRNCTFDVAAFYSIKLGTAATEVSNFIISGCTFYDIRAGVIDLLNVKKGQITKNRVYNATARIPHFINCQNATAIANLSIEGNITDGVNRFFVSNLACTGISITNNKILGAVGRSIELGGGGYYRELIINNNTFKGDYSGTIVISTVTYSDSPIFCWGTALILSQVSHNNFTNTGAIANSAPFIFTDTRTLENSIKDNMFDNFKHRYKFVANLLYNGYAVLDVKELFGAKGTGGVNDAPAIQEAINYARTVIIPNGGTGRIMVYFPGGTYNLDTPLDATDANGIILKGEGGKYINTLINGNTNGIIFDMTGSQMCSVEGFTFVSDRNASQPSTIGVQFALSKDPATGNQRGGLNCSIKNCYFQMNDKATVNGGLGTIGILNCRSEEFFIENCVISANAPLVFTSSYTMSTLTPYNFVVASPFASVQTDANGSMGVVNIVGTSLISVSRRSPAMVLNGVNAFNFEGYIGRFGDPAIGFTTGAEETAIRVYNTTYSLKVKATVESYSTLLDLSPTGKLFNSDINCTVANQRMTVYDVNNNWVSAPTVPIITMQAGSEINASDVRIAFGNGQNEIGNVRNFIASASQNGGQDESLCSVRNSDFYCQQWFDNTRFMQADLLKKCSDVHLRHGQAVSKEGEFWVRKFNFPKVIGTFVNGGAGTTGNIIRFGKINNSTTLTNAAFYSLRYEGMITIGNDGSGNLAMGHVSGEVLLIQNAAGVASVSDAFGIQNIKATTNGAALVITDVIPNISTINSSIYGLTLTVKGTGIGVGEPIRFHGQVKISSWSRASESVLFD